MQEAAPLKPSESEPHEHREAPPVRRYRGLNLLVSVFFIALLTLLALPAIHSSREKARMLQCQGNMSTIGTALQQYSNLHAGIFPSVSQMPDPTHRIAGIYAPLLMNMELPDMMSPQVFLCPAVSGSGRYIPSLSQFTSPMPPAEQETLHRAAGGDYAYNIGYTIAAEELSGHSASAPFPAAMTYHPPRDLRRPEFVLLADAPQYPAACTQNVCLLDLKPPARNSHGKLGINLLHEDGHVSTVLTPEILRADGSRDLLYLNDAGNPAPGIGPSDIVLGRSELLVETE